MCDIKEKIVIVTGGANGIGAATVRNFLKEGAKFVAFPDVDEKSGIALEADLLENYGRDKVKYFKCDVSRDEELFNVYKYVIDTHGYVDVVVNNAGIVNDELYKKQIDINFTAVVTSTLKALDIMRKDRGGKGGTIINISSIGALYQKSPTVFIYSATKSAILMLSSTMGMEGYYSITGVRLLTVCFGLTETTIQSKGIDEICRNGLQAIFKTEISQTAEAAAVGVIEACKKGNSGSTWLVKESEIMNITDRITKAYQIMFGELEV